MDAFQPLDQHLAPLANLEVSGLESAPKKDLNVTEYIYMIQEDLPESLLPVIKKSSNIAYSLHVHCKGKSRSLSYFSGGSVAVC